MAPIVRQGEKCFTFYNISTDRSTNSTTGTNTYSEDDKHALLYIVCTLLFYSLGIMIGIVSYIKREKEDIQQEKMFDEFLTSFRGKTEAIHYRQLKVQETIERLDEIERARQNSFDDFDGEKKISGKRKQFYKLASVSFIDEPSVLVNSMSLTSVAASNEQERDNMDPFLGRRLSEVVAEMIADEGPETLSEPMETRLKVKEEKDNKNEFRDCGRALENKDFCKESLKSKAESDFYDDKLVTEKNTETDIYNATVAHDELKPEYPQDVCNYMKTNTSSIIETNFEINVPQKNHNITNEEQLNKETNFVPRNEWRRKKYKVTTV